MILNDIIVSVVVDILKMLLLGIKIVDGLHVIAFGSQKRHPSCRHLPAFEQQHQFDRCWDLITWLLQRPELEILFAMPERWDFYRFSCTPYILIKRFMHIFKISIFWLIIKLILKQNSIQQFHFCLYNRFGYVVFWEKDQYDNQGYCPHVDCTSWLLHEIMWGTMHQDDFVRHPPQELGVLLMKSPAFQRNMERHDIREFLPRVIAFEKARASVNLNILTFFLEHGCHMIDWSATDRSGNLWVLQLFEDAIEQRRSRFHSMSPELQKQELQNQKQSEPERGKDLKLFRCLKDPMANIHRSNVLRTMLHFNELKALAVCNKRSLYLVREFIRVVRNIAEKQKRNMLTNSSSSASVVTPADANSDGHGFALIDFLYASVISRNIDV